MLLHVLLLILLEIQRLGIIFQVVFLQRNITITRNYKTLPALKDA